MNIVEWFDVKKPSHLVAWKHFAEKGSLPAGFVPQEVEFSSHWQVAITAKLADAFLFEKTQPQSKTCEELISEGFIHEIALEISLHMDVNNMTPSQRLDLIFSILKDLNEQKAISKIYETEKIKNVYHSLLSVVSKCQPTSCMSCSVDSDSRQNCHQSINSVHCHDQLWKYLHRELAK